MKTIKYLIETLESPVVIGDTSIEIKGIAYDSRQIHKGELFVAWKGFELDGHKYIDSAIAKGAVAIVTDMEHEGNYDVVQIKVANPKKALGIMASRFYDEASKHIDLIGITGTNGKSSITTLVQGIYKAANKDLAMITTMGNYINGNLYPTENTTPESLILHRLFYQMVEQGVSSCMMEVSSHALSLDRVEGCYYQVGVFTNLTPDHLEFHHTMEAYYEAKRKLFFMTSKANIINGDDAYGKRLIEDLKDCQTPLFTYGLTEEADFYAKDIVNRADGSSFVMATPNGEVDVDISFPGDIYIYNALAAAAVGYVNGIKLEDLAKGLEATTTIKGRFETVVNTDEYHIMIDFSHTEDSLSKTLSTLKANIEGRLLLVYGVYSPTFEDGASKREGMARVASELADFSVVTSDNPRFNDPQAIMDEVTGHMDRFGGKYHAILDRKEAIEYAIDLVEAGDLLLLAGKGHETYQDIRGEKVPFVEREIVLTYISNKKLGK